MSKILKKFSSRKFLLALIGTISGLALALGVEGSEIERIVATAGGVVTAVGSILTYINGEAMVDAAAVQGNSEEG